MADAWRLLVDGPQRGAWNMAVDEAILESAGAGKSLPTLRLYAWEPACLSLGYAQAVTDVDQARLDERGWDLVRRPTGGRAVLHVDELTYAVCGPADEPRLAGTVLESYHRLAAALVEALRRLGMAVQVQEHSKAAGMQTNPVCFEVPSTYEITADGKKLVGSAQARRREGVLQHGSLPLWGDLGRIFQVLVFADEVRREAAKERLYMKAATVEGAMKRLVTWEEAAEAYRLAFGATLNLELRVGELTLEELGRARELERTKYGNLNWTVNKQV